MPFRRAIVVVALLAAACAPAPSFDGVDAPAATDDTSTTTTSTTAPATVAPDTTEFAPVPGRIVTHSDTASILMGDRTIDLKTGDLPRQPTWARDGSRLVVASVDGRLPVVDVFQGATGAPIHRTFAERLYFFFSWSPDGSRIAALGPGAEGTTLDILDADGNLLQSEVASAMSLFLAWEPNGERIAAHADASLLRIDADGTVADLGVVGTAFFAPKWIPESSEIMLVVDIEGTATLVRRGVEGGAPMTTLGPVETDTGISVTPDGHRAAISMIFNAEGGGAARTTRFPQTVLTKTVLAQTVQPQTGTVEIVDLLTGERELILEGQSLWMEWNPQGTRLLVSILDGETNTTTWWIHESESADTYPVTSFTASPVFLQSYLIFGDQFIEQPRLWSPAGDQFVFAELTPDGSFVRIAPAQADAESSIIGAGDVGFWSPSTPTP